MSSAFRTILALFRIHISSGCTTLRHYQQQQQTIARHLATMSSNKDASTANTVFVQHSPGTDMMTISFEYSANGKTKSFNLYRKADEPLALALERIKLNLVKLTKLKKPKKELNSTSTVDEPKFNLELEQNERPLDPSKTSNVEAWREGTVMNLNGNSFVIRRNQPQVTLMKLPGLIMKGFITLPFVDLANCDIHECKFDWYRQISAKERATFADDPAYKDRVEVDGSNYYLHLATGLTYSPTISDIAHHLKVVCRPSNGTKFGPAYSYLSGRSVELGPEDCPFMKRHEVTSQRFEKCDKIRFVTYNILADLYADQDYSRRVLFAHCPTHALDIDYRRQLLLKEIHGYNADIVCLQEVDRREFKKTYEPYFRIVTNHMGVFNTKGGEVGEGVATFFREDRFELLDTHRTILSRLIDPLATTSAHDDQPDEAVPTKAAEKCDDEDESSSMNASYSSDKHPILDDLTSREAIDLLSRFGHMKSKMESNPRLMSRFMNRHTILQTNLLKSKDKSNTYVIVANTHLYFAPDADHVRLLQGSACAKYMEYIKTYYTKMIESKTGQSEPRVSIIFCGDMNSSPDCGLYKLLQEGKVDDKLKDWHSNEAEAVKGLTIETGLRFASAYRDIPYTNYTPGFNGCLDYIYYELDGFDCESTVPLPDHEDVTATEGIPSTVFPSDHLALIADLKLK